MSFAFFMARRYLTSLAVVAVTAVAIAVAVQILVLSVMRGFRADLMTKFLGLNPHIRVASEEMIQTAGVQFVPSVEGEGILTIDSDISTGIKIRGVTANTLMHMPALEWSVPKGSDPMTVMASQREIPVVTIGSELAGQIGVTPDGGRTVTLIAPFGQVSPSGDLIPQRMKVKVGGVFRSGLYEIDQSLVLMDQVAARRLLGPQAGEAWWGYVDDPMVVTEIAHQLRDSHPQVKITTWQEENAALFGALKLERIVMTSLLAVVVAIAATGITGVLFLLALWRRQEMSVLIALGCTMSDIRKIFLLYGGMIGAIGSAIGAMLALAGCAWISHGGIPLPESLYLHTLPVSVSISGLVIVAVSACALTMVAAWYPTRDLGATAIAQQLKGE